MGAVVSFDELHEGRKGEWELEKGHRTYTRVYRVFTDGNLDDSTVVFNSVLMPALGAAYPWDAGALCLKKSATPVNDLFTEWLLHCEYDSKLPFPEQTNKDPTARNPKWVFGTSKYQKALQYDTYGLPMVNSACQPFDPPFEVEASRPTIEITVWKATFSYPFVTSVVSCINNNTWNGFSKWQVKCESCNVTQIWENNQQCWELKYNLTINTEGWQPIKILDQGLYERVCVDSSGNPITTSAAGDSFPDDPDPEGGTSSPGMGDPSVKPTAMQCGCAGALKIIKDKLGMPVNAPVLLNGQGQQTQTPYYIWRYPYTDIDFSGIP
jgi:hypothetical protein